MSIYIYLNYKCIFAYSILYLSTVQSPTDTFKTPRYIMSFVFFAGPGCDLQVASWSAAAGGGAVWGFGGKKSFPPQKWSNPKGQMGWKINAAMTWFGPDLTIFKYRFNHGESKVPSFQVCLDRLQPVALLMAFHDPKRHRWGHADKLRVERVYNVYIYIYIYISFS